MPRSYDERRRSRRLSRVLKRWYEMSYSYPRPDAPPVSSLEGRSRDGQRRGIRTSIDVTGVDEAATELEMLRRASVHSALRMPLLQCLPLGIGHGNVFGHRKSVIGHSIEFLSARETRPLEYAHEVLLRRVRRRR